MMPFFSIESKHCNLVLKAFFILSFSLDAMGVSDWSDVTGLLEVSFWLAWLILKHSSLGSDSFSCDFFLLMSDIICLFLSMKSVQALELITVALLTSSFFWGGFC